MLHFLFLVTGSLMQAALLAGLLLGYAARRDLLEIRAPAKYGAVTGIFTAAGIALLEFTTALIVREYYNLAVLCLTLATESALYVRLAVTRSLAPEKAATLFFRFIFFMTTATWGAFYLTDIFIYPSHFAVGVVQVASSDFVFIVTGYAAGLALCLLAGFAAYKIFASLPEKENFLLFSLGFSGFYVTQLVTTGQTLLGRGILPRYDWALDGIIFLLNNADLLLYWILGVTSLAACLLWRRSSTAEIEGENPARRRKARSRMRTSIRWSKTTLLSLLAGLLVMTIGASFDNRKVELSPPQEMSIANGEISHSIPIVGDGALHRFVYRSSEGVDIRYIIIKKSETAFGVGLDACDVCGPSGYYERKGQVVCILCDVVMNKSTIGFAGGCNPVPLKFSLKDGCLIIKTEDLEAEAPRFM
jgi:uncharacterized membrane protein